jgi:hypothetical protein
MLASLKNVLFFKKIASLKNVHIVLSSIVYGPILVCIPRFFLLEEENNIGRLIYKFGSLVITNSWVPNPCKKCTVCEL